MKNERRTIRRRRRRQLRRLRKAARGNGLTFFDLFLKELYLDVHLVSMNKTSPLLSILERATL